MSQLDATLDAQFTQLVTEAVGDPRPIYAELRERAPVYRTPFGFWYTTSHALATTIGRDSDTWTVSAPSGHRVHGESYAPGYAGSSGRSSTRAAPRPCATR